MIPWLNRKASEKEEVGVLDEGVKEEKRKRKDETKLKVVEKDTGK